MKSRFSALLLAGCANLTLVPAAALAQGTEDTEARQQTVVVTGTRQAYQGEFEVLEVPQADLVIDSDALRDAGVLNLNQALDLSASVARQNNFGGLWNSFAVRGFVGDENLPSNYLVNGFNAGRGFGGPRDISGIESVEVLKGPRAALFGRGEPGGTVNLVTKRPTFETAGELKLAAGSFDFYRADADYTSPLSGNAAFRVTGFYEDAGSFRDTIETLKYGANPSIALKLGGSTQMVYEAEFSRQEIPFDRGVLAINGELGRIPESRFLGEPGDGPLEADVLGHQLELQHDFNDDWSALVGLNYRETSLQGTSTEAELAGSRQRLLNDGRSVSRQRRSRDYDATYIVLRGEITGRFYTGSIEHRIIAGVDTDEFENEQVFLRFRPPTNASNPSEQAANIIDAFNPVYGRFPLPSFSPPTNRVETQRSTGIFLQDQITLTDRLEVRLGGRYDDFEQELVNRANGSKSKQTESQFSPQFGAVYKASDLVSVYAAYGENFRPLSGSDFAGNAFDPNYSKSLEAGLKFALRSGALIGTVSVFSIEQENILTADPVNAGFSVSAGKAESEGFEFDLSGEIAEGLTLWASYAYVDAQVSNDVLDFNFALPIEAGDRLLNIPEQSLSLQLVKQSQLASRPLSFGAGLLHVGERLGEAGTEFELPAYTLARAFAAYDLTDALTLRAEVDNLFDETYYTNSFSQLWIQPGTPRSLRISAVVRF
ncbi:TonB-dependent siderophore receptor [Hyphomonas sp.]|uniref:TonB-dependent siderophore receptor n=1 Tax=Hyphomonas sp. TaxID=87 RepID=UPI0025C27261|nr:TonB-dependent siderophore receptor [Hyphomonas sp.]